MGVSLVDFLMDSPRGNVSLVGASGAVAALIGAHLASVMLNWSHDTFAMVNTIRPPTRVLGVQIPKEYREYSVPFPLSAKHIYR